MNYNYSQQSGMPLWYGSHLVNFCATSGSSPFNEWFGFDFEFEAYAYFRGLLHHSSSENFVVIGLRIYYADDVYLGLGGGLFPRSGSVRPSLTELAFEFSRF